MIEYPAKYELNEDGYYIEFIDLPDAFTQGDNFEELVENARDVLSGILQVMIDEKKEIPNPSALKGENLINITPYPEVALPLLFRKRRLILNESQGAISKQLNIPYTTYQRWERAENFNPTLKTLKKVADALGFELTIDLIPKSAG